jgi:UDP-3-O-[3-hydroxymyristoyl] glucosamine N-acyltransferase
VSFHPCHSSPIYYNQNKYMSNESAIAALTRGIRVQEIADLISATVIGDSNQLVKSFCALNQPIKDAITFAKSGGSADVKSALASGKLAAIIVPKELEKKHSNGVTQLVVKDPLYAISLLTKKFLSAELPAPGLSKMADIHPSAKIGNNVHIGAFCSVGKNAEIKDHAVLFPQVVVYAGAVIGERAVIHSGAVIRENCKVGKDCLVQNGAIVGADGFGYFLNPEKKIQAVPQVGIVEISDEVEIGANTCIDRATIGTTSIGSMTKIDNLVQVGHNTKIGQGSIVCGNAGIAGSCEIGNGVTLGGGVGVADHVKIEDGVRVGGNSGVTGDIKEKGDYVGFPAVKALDWKRQVVSLEKLPAFLAGKRKTKKK